MTGYEGISLVKTPYSVEDSEPDARLVETLCRVALHSRPTKKIKKASTKSFFNRKEQQTNDFRRHFLQIMLHCNLGKESKSLPKRYEEPIVAEGLLAFVNLSTYKCAYIKTTRGGRCPI